MYVQLVGTSGKQQQQMLVDGLPSFLPSFLGRSKLS
jgi:hypothetical protein